MPTTVPSTPRINNEWWRWIENQKHTAALVTNNSTSPRWTPINVPNFSHTPSKIPRRLLSASVFRKFLIVLFPAPPPPMCLINSLTIWSLSVEVSVGADRIADNFLSLLNISVREANALAAWSKEDVFAAAVYCVFVACVLAVGRIGFGGGEMKSCMLWTVRD